jgi:hypothetical protein
VGLGTRWILGRYLDSWAFWPTTAADLVKWQESQEGNSHAPDPLYWGGIPDRNGRDHPGPSDIS